MVILDTDHMSLLEWSSLPETQRLRARLSQLPEEEVATTIVCYEEQIRGWMAVVAKARTVKLLIEAYRRLRNQLSHYCEIPVIEFDENSAIEYQRFLKARIRIGTLDLRIAAIAKACDATVLSRNLSDFRKVPGLKVEDWTV